MRGSRLIAYEQTPFVETYTRWDTVRHFFHVAQLPIRLENQSLRGVHAASEYDPAPRRARNAHFAKFDNSSPCAESPLIRVNSPRVHLCLPKNG
jgi:hypothetical protein